MKNLHELDSYRLKENEVELYGIPGNHENGCFKVFAHGRSFFVIASNDGGWEHVSVSPCNPKRKSCPTWEEMCVIKDLFFLPEECVIEYHPPKSQYINDYPYCLHLWRPIHQKIPMPPNCFV